jgi:DNA-binding MarR family transcriptional regulator
VNNAFRLAVQDVLRELPLSLPLASVLLDLSEEDGLSSAELARRETVTAQTMNQLVARLVDRGLVARRRHQTHGRILTLHLTPAGRQMLHRGEQLATRVEHDMLRDFSAQERRRLLDDLNRCARALAEPARVAAGA